MEGRDGLGGAADMAEVVSVVDGSGDSRVVADRNECGGPVNYG